MKRLLKFLGFAAVGLVVLLLVATAVGYALVSPVAQVPATVIDDPNLPSFTANGVRLHARVEGDALERETVIVLHGGPGDDHRSLLPVAALADSFRVVFYDQRGSGLSQRLPAAQLTLADHYRDLTALADHWAPRGRVHLVGHSWGAMLATGWAARNPGRVSGLVLVEPGLLTDEAGAAFLEKTHGMRPPMTLHNLGIVARGLLESLHVGGPDSDARADYLALRIMANPDVEGHPLAGYWCGGDLRRASLEHWRFGARVSEAVRAEGTDAQGSFRVDFGSGVDRLEHPPLFLVGACDRILGEEHQRRFHVPLFRDAKVVVVPDAGHTLLGEKPAESVAAIRAYLGSLGGRPSGS